MFLETETILRLITNILLISLTLFTVYYLLVLLVERRKSEQLLSLHKYRKKNSVQKIGEHVQSVQKLYGEIDEFLRKRGKNNISDLVFYGIVALTLIIFIGMLLTGQFILAIVYPIAFIWFVRRMMVVATKDPIVEMEEELPMTIDNMIRILSRYSDIRTVMYETSLTTKGPLRKELDLLVSQMNTRNPIVVLEEFSCKHNSVWLNNFGFTLLGYLGDSSKEETIQNLRHLRNLLSDDTKKKKDAIKERKPSVMINYALAAVGVVTGIANILFNPYGFDFFFHSYIGLFCFTIGFASVLGTIYMNIKMLKIEK